MADEEEVIQDGSEEHPWLANNYADMVDYLTSKTDSDGNQPCWVRLTTDINCNEVCPTGWSSVVLDNHLDMYGHKIIAPLVKDGNFLFYTHNTNKVKLINGHILNIYENFTSRSYYFFTQYNFSTLSLINMQLDFYLRHPCDASNLKTIKNCRISVRGKLSGTGTFISCSNISECIFELNYKQSDVANRLLDGYRCYDCLFTGEVDNFNLNSGTTSTSSSATGEFENCIIAVKSSNTESRGYRPHGNNLISSDTKGMTIATEYGTAEVLTDAQLKSLTEVQATNFTVTPVSTTSGGT